VWFGLKIVQIRRQTRATHTTKRKQQQTDQEAKRHNNLLIKGQHSETLEMEQKETTKGTSTAKNSGVRNSS